MLDEYVVEIPGLVPQGVTIALKEDLTISEDLEREISRCASLYGYYAVLSEKASYRLHHLKLRFEMWEAETEKAIVADRAKQGHKPFKNVKDLTREVMALPKWLAYQLKIAQYKEHAEILKHVAKAFEMKMHLVQTRCANRRKESNG